VDDGVSAPITGVKSVTGTAVNDAPTATNLSAVESYVEDTPLDLVDIVVSDVDNPGVAVSLTLSDPAAGSLGTGTSGATASTYDAVTGVWAANGAIADVNALLAGLTFTPALNYSGDFTIFTSVGDGAAPAGVKDVTGTAVNDAPALVDNALTIGEGGTVTLSNMEMSAADVDNAAAGLTFTVSAVSGGQFELITSPSTAVNSFTQAQITGGAVRFVHDGGETAPSYQVTVFDGSSSGGPAAATVIFTNVNDGPILLNNRLTVTEQGSVVLTGADLSATDVDNDGAGLTFTVSAVTGGRFELTADPGVVIVSFTQAQVTGGAVRFVHDGGAVAPSYQVSVSDGSLSAGPAAATVSFIQPKETTEPPPLPLVTETGGPTPVREPIPNDAGSLPPEVPTLGGPVSSGGPQEEPSSSVAPAPTEEEFQSVANRDAPDGADLTPPPSRIVYRPSSEKQEGIAVRDEVPMITANPQTEDTETGTVARGDLGSVLDASRFVQELNKLREEVAEDTSLEKFVVGSTLTAATGFSIGYVLWLVRGEVLLTSLLASLPAWRLIDPLPVLSFFNKRPDGEDDDSIESAVKNGAGMPRMTPEPKQGTRPVKWRMVLQPPDSIPENSL
jgi:hypothetical protein